MTFTALTMLATVSLGQPAAPANDVRFVAKRTLSIPVTFKPEKVKELEKARLFVSRDNGDLYDIHDTIAPTQSGFTLTAKEDGVYWIQMQLQYKDGTVDPVNPRTLPPAEKLIVDTTKPVVTIAAAEFVGDEIAMEWKIDEKHPSEASTRVFYKPATGGDTAWKEAPAGSIKKRSAQFKPDLIGAITVQVATADLAGNVGHMNKEVPTRGGVTPVGATGGEVIPMPGSPNTSRKEAFGPSAPLPTPNFEPSGLSNFTAPDPPKPIASSAPAPAGMPVAPAPVAAPVENSPIQYSRSPRFDLNYSLDSGASGVARIDLYVTRDDGRSWARWSQHDGRETPLKVVLDTRFNKDVEGDYGFALVPVSGAGLSEGAPTAGSAPEMRLRLDTTAPSIKVFQPTADANNKNALVLNWEASDKNFGKDPVAIEYSEQPQGPWKSVSGTDGTATSGPHRIENSGSYSWQPPLNLTTPKVYLRFTAWDQAGNKSEVVTPNPILVDLMKPKARIQGIAAPAIGR